MVDVANERSPGPFVPLFVCPVEQAGLFRDGETFVCTDCRRRYPIEEGIPNLLVEPAEQGV